MLTAEAMFHPLLAVLLFVGFPKDGEKSTRVTG